MTIRMSSALSHPSKHEILNEREGFISAYNHGLGSENIIYVDDDIIVVNKPSHAQSVPGFLYNDSIATRIAQSFKIPRVDQIIVHRLDYATSGILIFARNINALRNLNEQFRGKGNLKKTYLAMVSGIICEAYEGEIDLPLEKDIERGSPFCRVDVERGKPSMTKWRQLGSSGNSTLMELIPITGRTHQLRIHMASIGHPILGDFFYAPDDVFRQSSRLLLHANYVSLRHPRTAQLLQFRAPCPFTLENIPSNI